MSSGKPFEIGGRKIAPGTRERVDLPIATLYTNTPVTLPVLVVRGREPGPCLFVSAALHGDEINGIEVIRRLLKVPELEQLRGTLLAVPIVNTLAFLHRSRYMPDRRDLNRSFPGSESGSLAARVAHLFLREVVTRSDFGVDLHTGARDRPNLPQIRGDLTRPDLLRLSQNFGVPLLLNSEPTSGTLRDYAMRKKTPMILYEAGEALRLDELCIRVGVKGVLNVMSGLDMLARPVEQALTKKGTAPIVARSSTWVRAADSGMMRAQVALGDAVKAGQCLAMIGDPFGESECEVTSPVDGVVIGRLVLPLVHEGDALFNIALVDMPEATGRALASMQEHVGDAEVGPSGEPAIT